MTDETQQIGATREGFERLSEVDQDWLRLWRESLMLQDARYENKLLLKLVIRAMLEPGFRAELLARGDVPTASPESNPNPLKIRFHENTADTINVVIPRSVQTTQANEPRIRELLRSRTEATTNWFADDFNVGDITDPSVDVLVYDTGDGHPRDGGPPVVM